MKCAVAAVAALAEANCPLNSVEAPKVRQPTWVDIYSTSVEACQEDWRIIAVEFMEISQGCGPRGPAKGSAADRARSAEATILTATAEEPSRAHCFAVRQATSSPTTQMSPALMTLVRRVWTDVLSVR